MFKITGITAIAILLLTSHMPVRAQVTQYDKAMVQLEERGEVILLFRRPQHITIANLSRIVSIDNVGKDSVRAYANLKQFTAFLETGIEYEVPGPPGKAFQGSAKSYLPVTSWEVYPTYEQYDSLMVKFAENYPSICRLDTIGYTTGGRLLLAVKISDNPGLDEAEPEFFYSSTIHGDEIVGYVLMLHLTDHLLKNYGADPQITWLIDTTEIWINPNANPDGTYKDGNNSVWGAVRYNLNNIDLNRNYPDPQDGPHPDGNEWQAETVAMMDFMKSRNFAMSANFHSGAEVLNYPWDTWVTRHADDSWFRFISREYADTVHVYSSGYMTGFDNGITNGYDWYSINGGRQDYMTYFLHGREVTIELDDVKLTPEDQLSTLWEYNYRSLLNYISQVTYGIQGIVTDKVTGDPVRALVTVVNHDLDSSQVRADSLYGFYVRLIDEGTWDLAFSAEGYQPLTVTGVNVARYQTTRLDVTLVPETSSVSGPPDDLQRLEVFPNPFNSSLTLRITLDDPSEVAVSVTDMTGRLLHSLTGKIMPAGTSEIKISLPSLAPGVYILGVHTSTGTAVRRIIHR